MQRELEVSEGLTYVPSVYDPSSVRNVGGGSGSRKVPKIIHIMSKAQCFTETFTNNINLWANYPNQTFLAHDNEAVDALLIGRDWPEFPSSLSSSSLSGARQRVPGRLTCGGTSCCGVNRPGQRTRGAVL